MYILKTLSVIVVSVLMLSATSSASELPASFPDDVPLADYMSVVGVTEVGRSMMINLHAPGKSIDDVVKWFKLGLTAEGWESEGGQVSSRKAILAYTKNGRRCGVSVTNFVMNASMQMDDSIKGITLQVTGAASPVESEAESAADAIEGAASN